MWNTAGYHIHPTPQILICICRSDNRQRRMNGFINRIQKIKARQSYRRPHGTQHTLSAHSHTFHISFMSINFTFTYFHDTFVPHFFFLSYCFRRFQLHLKCTTSKKCTEPDSLRFVLSLAGGVTCWKDDWHIIKY